MLRKLDSVGGLLLTHAVVGVAAFIYARGWATIDQATSFVQGFRDNWGAILLGAGGAGAAVTARSKAKR